MSLEDRLLGLPESRRNEPLRRRDWRFLLSSEDSAAPGALVEIGFPTKSRLRVARASLKGGGHVVCRWSLPRPRGAARACERLAAAGFEQASVHWPGPLPWRTPQFWLPLGNRAAREHLLATRPARGLGGRILRLAWRAAERLGLLAPLCAIGRAPGGPDADAIGAFMPPPGSVTLLSGGKRSINKVVALGFAEDLSGPIAVTKGARVPEAEAGLEREANALETVAAVRPGLAGVPRLVARGRRAGALALAESPVKGEPMLALLTEATFEELAAAVTGFLLELAGDVSATAPSAWRQRVVEPPLEHLAEYFGAVLDSEELGSVRHALDGLGDLPVVVEHRDCSPWNLMVEDEGTVSLLDWESSVAEGLPALDLVYFLANSAFVLDRALERGQTAASYRRMLDPGSRHGRVAARCLGEYADRIGLAESETPRLRMLCWVIHCRSDVVHMQLEHAGNPPVATLAASPFLGLLREELRAAREGAY